MEQKNILISKTFWFGLLTAISPLSAFFFPVIGDFMKDHLAEVTMLWGVAAVILRLVTKDKVVLGE